VQHVALRGLIAQTPTRTQNTAQHHRVSKTQGFAAALARHMTLALPP